MRRWLLGLTILVGLAGSFSPRIFAQGGILLLGVAQSTAGGGGGGGLAFSELTDNSSGGPCTSDPCTSASSTPTSGALIIAAYAASVVGGGTMNCDDQESVSISGTNGFNTTWTQIECRNYGTRRSMWVWRGVASSGVAGTVTFDASFLNGTFEAAVWSIDAVTGFNTGTPVDAATDCVQTAATSCAIADIGTADTGDCSYGVITHETNEAVTAEGGFTTLSNFGVATGIRTLTAMYDCTATVDETPSASWATSSSAGGIGFVVNVAP